MGGFLSQPKRARRTKPATGGGGWQPSDLTSLVAAYSFLSADGDLYEGTTGSGTAASSVVGSVAEFYGTSGLYLRNSGGSNRPTIDTNGVKCQGRNGSDDWFHCPNILQGASNFTFVMRIDIYTNPTDGGGRLISVSSGGDVDYGSTGFILLCRSTGNNSGSTNIMTMYSGGETADMFNPSVSHGTFFTLTAKYSFTVWNSPISLSIDGNVATSNFGGGSSILLDEVAFGGQRPSGGGNVPVILRRIIIADSVLTGSDLTNAEAWVAA